MRLVTLLLLVSLYGSASYAQNISGYVFGYSGKTINLRKKQPSFGGQLSGTRVSLIQGDETVSTLVTNSSGRFSINVPEPGKYLIVFSKAGYAMVSANIQVKKDAVKSLSDLFVTLKEGGKESAFCGTFLFEEATITFDAVSTEDIKDDLVPTNITLFKQSVMSSMKYPRNNQPTIVERIVEVPVQVRDQSPEEIAKEPTIEEEKTDDPNSLAVSQTLERIRDLSSQELNSQSLKELDFLVRSAKELLVKQDTSSVLYDELKGQIAQTERRLKDQSEIVAIKKREVAEADKKITYLGLFVGVLILSLGALSILLVQRYRYNRALRFKNKEVSDFNEKLTSSIRYASIIQKNFLKEPEQLDQLFSESLLFYQPKDGVSGDFFWFEQVGDFKILVAADCTGHGVPGAMLTVLGNAALNSIILEKGVTDPQEILTQLNDNLLNTFRGEEGDLMPHGMDVCVICVDNDLQVKVCGAVNGAYYTEQNKLKYLDATHLSLGETIQPSDWQTHTLQGKPGQTFFLFSDGYHDQFKGDVEDIETYNLERFETLLGKIATTDLSGGEEALRKEFNQWKGSREQVDDVLVIGVRL